MLPSTRQQLARDSPSRAESYACGMQGGGGEEKARARRQSGSVQRHFGGMRVAMEDREEADRKCDLHHFIADA